MTIRSPNFQGRDDQLDYRCCAALTVTAAAHGASPGADTSASPEAVALRMLHTADWHVGKTLRGRSRLDEHERVLNEIVEITRSEAIDVVAIAGDLFETSAPTTDAQQLVWRTLLALRDTGAEVVVVAGNHDSPHAFDAMRDVFNAARITMLGHPRSATNGGVITLTTASGDQVRVAMLPFVSQRFAVKAQQLFELSGADAVKEYAADYRALIHHLTSDAAPGCVNVLVAHCTIANSLFGGGERTAQSVFEYAVTGNVFPADLHYVALGHLHRSQRIGAPCPAWYSGSPIQVDFGETANTPKVLIVEAMANTPARVTEHELTTAARLQTVEGTVAELIARAPEFGTDWLRVRVLEPARAGLADEIRAALPNAVDIHVVAAPTDEVAQPVGLPRSGRNATELFSEYCASRNINDPRINELFRELLDVGTALSAPATSQGDP